MSVAEAVQALVPHVTVGPAARAGGVRGFFRAAVAGLPDTAQFTVSDGRGRFTVRYPDRAELHVGSLAKVVEAAAAMRTRFEAALDHLRLVSIDLGQEGFVSGRWAGVAEASVGQVHLNASLFLAGEYALVEEVTAHELWHQIEIAFNARRYRESIEFRRAVGAYFGVETIEHAVERAGQAHDQLVREVSDYAATSAIEATAELAGKWWCSRGRDDQPAVFRHFGAVVDRFFPPPAPPTEGAR
ncbi:MAG TPA: hypothetical protein VGO92_10940 [Acidimicrobiales bacterium]|nr:hypothetical protein [Acidimicrobiales bacterium]